MLFRAISDDDSDAPLAKGIRRRATAPARPDMAGRCSAASVSRKLQADPREGAEGAEALKTKNCAS